jgi:hypothetical protein
VQATRNELKREKNKTKQNKKPHKRSRHWARRRWLVTGSFEILYAGEYAVHVDAEMIQFNYKHAAIYTKKEKKRDLNFISWMIKGEPAWIMYTQDESKGLNLTNRIPGEGRGISRGERERERARHSILIGTEDNWEENRQRTSWENQQTTRGIQNSEKTGGYRIAAVAAWHKKRDREKRKSSKQNKKKPPQKKKRKSRPKPWQVVWSSMRGR